MVSGCPLTQRYRSYKRTKKPEKIITVGGHLDSWDIGEGAHDDGAGCVHSIGALRLFQRQNIKPNNTIRAVMFMNEEFGLRGGLKYAEIAVKEGEQHIAAIESDASGYVPRDLVFREVRNNIIKFKTG